MNTPARTAPRPLGSTEAWLFDLDNTLYSSGAAVFPQIHKRMLDFIMAEQKIDEAAAKLERSRYFHQHGTTMRGMMVERGVDPVAFMDYVHDIDLSVIEPAPRLDAAIARLPGRKLIFTNASAKHARNVLGALGVAHHFEALFDVGDCDWLPKPDATGYRNIVARHGVDPARAAMIDDIPANLRPAWALGMATVWVREPADPRWTREPPTHDHTDYVTGELVTWLEALEVGA